MHLDPKKANISDIQRLLLGGVSPRPIALVSTISEDGTNNLSPFSFFNAFGANPPVVGFSASRRVRDGGLKDTYNNLMATKECVIQAVTYDMVEQVSLSSTEYDTGVDEFIKSGLTPIDSYLVKAKRVKESPFQMECKLIDMINFSNEKGAGNLAICEVVYFHADDDIFDNGIIHPDLIDLVGRNSGNFYTRASGEALFEIEKPLVKKGIGYDNIPDFIKESHIFTANNLGRLGNSEILPDDIDVKNFINSFEKIEGSKSSYKRAFNQKKS
jgi:flavin reductase (DIM6/NTAB) family NADH-FMN oxidoreductase RutF